MEPRSVLVRAPNWLGDVVLSLGAVRDVRRNFPEARLEVLARPAVADLYRALSEIDGVRLCPSFSEGVAAARGCDVAVLLPNSFGSALQVRLAGVPERWGYARDGRGLLLTRRARVPRQVRGQSEAFYYRALLAGLGLEVSAAQDRSLSCPEEWRARGSELLGGSGPWVGLNPGAAFGSAKRWLPERYAALADRLAAEHGVRIAILGSALDRRLAHAIAGAMAAPARVLAGETRLAELVGVLTGLDLLVTNDSGPMHVAAALRTPLVAVFGPTDWRETSPSGPACRVVREPVECSPCKRRECPIDQRCMTRVSVERVLTAAQDLLKGARP
jgi:heptosyltransferase-2